MIRREFLASAPGLPMSMALSHLMAREAAGANPLAAKAPHFAPRAKAVIFMFMVGGPSQMDLFDPKPELTRLGGKALPEAFGKPVSQFTKGDTKCLASTRSFRRHGRSGLGMSDLLPNLAAPVLLARELHRLLGEHPDLPPNPGVVVNLLDQKLYGYNPDFLSYSLTKAGLAAANTMLAQALAPRVRVVGVAPGLTLPSYLQQAEEFERAHAQHSPLGRCSDPADVVAAVCFAIENRSMTGSVLVVDGGQHIRPLPRDVSLMPLASAPK